MNVSAWLWLLLLAVASIVYAVQWLISRRRPHEPSKREVVVSGVFAIAVTTLITLFVWLYYGGSYATALLSEYLTQYTLSIDVLFVLAVTMSLFAVPRIYQDATLAIAAILALAIRTGLIGLGALLTTRYSWIVFVSGSLVMFRVIVVAIAKEEDHDQFEARMPPRARLMRRLLPMSQWYDGPRMVTIADGRRMLTPMFLVVATLATTDMLFAPEPGQPLILFLATAAALLLIRPLFFLVTASLAVGRVLALGRLLAVVLVMVAVKMYLAGAQAVGVTHIGPITLPKGIADSVWIGFLLAVLITTALVRLARPPGERPDSARAQSGRGGSTPS